MLNDRDFFVYGVDNNRRIVISSERPNLSSAISRADKMVRDKVAVASYVLDSAGSSHYRVEPAGFLI